MANYTVTSLSGSALTEGSLSYAIAQVNAGNYTGITFDSSLKDEIIDLSAFEEINGTITISNGTLNKLNGKITIVTAEGDGYGISGSNGTRSITNSTGSISVEAIDEAVGIDGYYLTEHVHKDGRIDLTFDEMALELTAVSVTSDAYGIRLKSAVYYSYNYGISNCTSGDISGHITISAANVGYGIYVYGDAEGNSHLIANTVSSDISVVGGTDAYGLCVELETYNGSWSDDTEISVAHFLGSITVVGKTGVAHGIRAYGLDTGDTVVPLEAFSGKINGGYKDVVVKEAVYAEDGTLVSEAVTEKQEQAMIISGNIDVSGGTDSYGIYGTDVHLAVTEEASFDVKSTSGKAAAIHSTGTLTLDSLAGEINTITESKNTAYGIYSSGKIEIDNLSGSISVSGEKDAYGIYGSNSLKIDHFAGVVNVQSAEDDAWAIKTNSEAQISDFAGAISVEAENSAGGMFFEHNMANHWNTLQFTDIAGTVDVKSNGNGYGFISDHTNSNSFDTYLLWQMNNVSSRITVNANDTAAGIYAARTNTYSGRHYTERSFLHVSSWDADLDITSNEKAAYGIYVFSSRNHYNQTFAHNGLYLADFAGTMSITAQKGNAYGIYSGAEASDSAINRTASVKTIHTHVISSDDFSTEMVVSSQKNAFGIYSNPTYNHGIIFGGMVEPDQIIDNHNIELAHFQFNGEIIVDGRQGAYGIAGGVSKYITVNGIIAAGNYGISTEKAVEDVRNILHSFDRAQWNGVNLISNSTGYAIVDGYVDETNGSLQLTSSVDDIIINANALILGSIALGGGTNTLTVSTGAQIYGDITANSLNLNFTIDAAPSVGAVITANSAGALIGANTNYIIDLSSDSQSGRYVLATADDLSSLANKIFTVNYLDETYSVTAGDDFEDNPFVDINIVNGRELELVVSNTFFVYNHNIANDMIGKDRNDSITLSFSKALDADSFSLDLVSMTDKNGRNIAITSYEINGNKLTLNYDPITEEGKYTLKLSEKIKNVDGGYLDQNLNQTAGETDDNYSIDLTADFTAPKVLKVTPDTDFAGTLTTLQITFSSAIDFASLKDQISLVTPAGKTVTPASYKQITGSCIEVTVSEQTAYGEYQIRVGNQIMDLAGNKLDQNGDGIFGSEEDVFTGKFSITEIDLKVADVVLNKTTFAPGEKVTINWNTFNNGGYALSGSWTDGIYLSTDTRWDVNDIKLGELSHDGGLAKDQQLANTLDVNLAGVTAGNYYILVRSDIYMQEKGNREDASAAQNLQAVEIRVEIPELKADKTVTVSNVKAGDHTYFHFVQEADTAVKLNLDSLNKSDVMEIYIGEGYTPSRQKYDQEKRNITDGTLHLAANDKARDLYITVYTKNAASDTSFTLTAQTPDVEIISLTPAKQSMQTDSFFEVQGMNFAPDAVITLRDQNGKSYTPSATYFVDSGKMRFEFTKGNLNAGVYDLCVTVNGKTAVKEDSITMVAGSGAELKASLTTPATVGYHIAATLTFNYSNTGFSSMDAPMIILNPTLYKETITEVKYFINEKGEREVYSDTAWKAFEDRLRNATSGMNEQQFKNYLQSKSYYLEGGSNVSISEDMSGESQSSLDKSYGSVSKEFTIDIPASNAASDDEISRERSESIGGLLARGDLGSLSSSAGRPTTSAAIPFYIGTVYTQKYSDVQQQDGAILTVDPNLQHTGFWTKNVPEGYSSSVSFLASGNNGILMPGESGSVDIYYNGWDNDYWDYSYPPVKWNLSYITTGNTAELNWKENLAGLSLATEIKNILVSNLNVSVGSTWGSYVKMLNSNMKYLADIGADVTEDTSELFRFELMQASGALSPFRTLESNSDVAIAAPGLALEINRNYNSDLFSRDTKGSFGYGWTCNWDISLEIEKDGDLILKNGTSTISYQVSAQSSSSKTIYMIVEGDDGSEMKKVKNGYKLIKRDGTVYQFDTTGKLNSVTDSNGNSISCGYTAGDLTSLTHSSGQNVQIVRNSDGMIASVTDQTGRVMSYTYSNGNLTSVKDSLSGKTVSYTYNGTHGLTSSTDVQGQITQYTYDEKTGLLSKISSRNGKEYVKITYGNDGDVYITESSSATGATAALRTGKSYVYFYDADGKLARMEDKSSGEITYYRYDQYGNLQAVKNSRKHSISISANEYGETTSLTDAFGNTQRYTYDSNGRIIRSVDERGNTSEFDYDKNGNLSAAYYADGTSLSFTYDGKGNLSSMTDAKGNKATYSYNAAGQCTAMTFDGKTINCEYDAQGNLVGLTQADGSKITYEYNGMDNMTLFTDANGNSIVYSYDTNGNLTGIKRIDNTSETFAYNQYNDLTTWTTRRGTKVDYTYTADGNLQKTSLSDGTSYSYTYDDYGRVTQAGNIQYTYNGQDLILTQKASGSRNISYSYDNFDRVISISDGVNTTNYTYTVLGDIDTLTNASGKLIADYDYDRFGKLEKITRGNETCTVYSYNDYQELSEIRELDKAGNTVSFIQYHYDAESRISAKTTADGTWNYTYDKKGQLVKAVQTAADGTTVLRSEEYTYDKAGNRLTSVVDGVTKTYVYDNMNRIVSCNGIAYKYDADGNLLEDEERIYTWTADNRVASEKLKSSGQVWTYTYDALGNRTSVTTNGMTTSYTVDVNGNVLAEYVNGVFSRSYIQGDILAGFTDANGNTCYFTNDILGSTTAITNASGITVNTYAYDSFGNVISSTEGVANDFEFVGGYGLMANASGTTFVRARNYDPVTGRWISEDPIGINGGENLYVYCGNDGVNYIDISGNIQDVANDALRGSGATIGFEITKDVLQQGLKNSGSGGRVAGGVLSGIGHVKNAHDGLIAGGNVSAAAISKKLHDLRNKHNINPDDGELWNLYQELDERMRMGSKALTMGSSQFNSRFGYGDKSLQEVIDLFNQELRKQKGVEIPGGSSNQTGTEDPNDKLGPEGVGELKYVAANQEFDYTIRFENDPEMANSPVKWVRVYDTLDSDFDIDTFEIKEFNLAGTTFKIPDGLDSYEDKVSVTVDGKTVLVDVAIGLEYSEEIEAWQLIAKFMAIDPETGAMLQEPLEGFLYPNDDTGKGDGHISYSISLKKGVANKTKVDNMAEIYFDFNEPIDTPMVSNTVDTAAPNASEMVLTQKDGTVTINLSATDAESGIAGYYLKYSLDGVNFYEYCVSTAEKLTFSAEAGTTYYFIVQAFDKVGNASAWSDVVIVSQNRFTMPAGYTAGTFATLACEGENVPCKLILSQDNFASFVTLSVAGAADLAGVNGTYQWQMVDASGAVVGSGVLNGSAGGAEAFVSTANGQEDIFFAQPNSQWNDRYAAQHNGNLVNNWQGTGEQVLLEGKNKFEDIFIGSEDKNKFYLTDSANGDALFLDDIYTNGVRQSRLSGIDTLFAGAGDDVIDFTSSRYAYVGTGTEVYGGSGDDTIWMASGSNLLLGERGDDRLVGGAHDDVISGGAGNDTLHGGGGNDIFTFGGDFGNDVVEQLGDGTAFFWFGDLQPGAVTISYSGNDTVLSSYNGTVTVKNKNIDAASLRFGSAGSETEFSALAAKGAFEGGALQDLTVCFVGCDHTTTDQRTAINFVLQNTSTVSAGASVAYIYDGSTKLGEVAIASFAPWEQKTGQFIIAPNTLAPGEHVFKVVTDATGVIEERNEENNELAESVVISGNVTEPDLTLGYFSAECSYASGEVIMQFSIKNNSDVSVGASTILIYDGEKGFSMIPIEALEARAETLTYTWKADIYAFDPGIHVFTVVVDGLNVIAERNENNNSRSVTFDIYPDRSKAESRDGVNTVYGTAGDDCFNSSSADELFACEGGSDLVVFGSGWGHDSVRQLDGGSVTLCFEEGSEGCWDAETLTYDDGINGVVVCGTTDVTVVFGKLQEEKKDGFLA